MEPKSELELLEQIRDIERRNSALVDELCVRVDALCGVGWNEPGRVERFHDELSCQIVESGMRSAKAIADITSTLRELVNSLTPTPLL